ncbi:MAG: hypothetical protein H6577_24655 [Lewinellaceae bacterium]|nr:hypothetical protein [Lewinellaceae bacterium]
MECCFLTNDGPPYDYWFENTSCSPLPPPVVHGQTWMVVVLLSWIADVRRRVLPHLSRHRSPSLPAGQYHCPWHQRHLHGHAHQWRCCALLRLDKNGMNVGNYTATYTDAALADGDVITCIMNSNDPVPRPLRRRAMG